MNHLLRCTALAVLTAAAGAVVLPGAVVPTPKLTRPAKLDLRKGDRVVLMGDTFAEREVWFGYLETALQSRFPDLGLTFRNLAYAADTTAVLADDMSKTQIGDDDRVSNRALNFGTMPQHLTAAKADVIFLCLGMADSFAGAAGLADFEKNLQAVLKNYGRRKFNGTSPPRLVLVGPIAHEDLGGPFPNPAEHNKQLRAYSEAMRKIAAATCR
jgi:hypothetical protein